MSYAPPEYEDSPLNGLDFSWLAVDSDGHVAWLVTFGSAVVPRWVEEASHAFSRVEKALATLPERGTCSTSDTSSHAEEWRAAARRGLFAYDWDVYSGPYRTVAAPDLPLQLQDLPPELAALAQRTCFTQRCFRHSTTLQAADVAACVPGPTSPSSLR